MSKHRTLLYNLVVFPRKEKGCFPIYFLSEKDEKLGQLFIIGKLEIENKAFKKTIDYLVNFIEDNYFNQAISNPEIALENVLQRVNEEWQIEISKHKHDWDEETLKRQLKNLNLLVGVIKDNMVYFVHIGKAHVFLIRDNKIVDILSSLDGEKRFGLFKLFTNIVSGNLKIEDRVFFCFADILDFFSLEKIKRIIKDYNPPKAGQYFQDLLHSIDSEKTFVATILGVYSKRMDKTAATPIHVPVAHEDSMQQLTLKQQKTEKFIHPSILPSFGVIIKNLVSRIKQIINNKSIKTVKVKIGKIFSPLKKKLSKIFSAIKGVASKLPKIPKPKITKLKLPQIKFPEIRRKRKLLVMPPKNKLYLIAAFVLVALLIFGVVFSISRQANKKEQERFDNVVKQIEEKHGLAEAALIYDNEGRAKTLLQEVQALLAELPQNKPQRQEKYQQLAKKNQEQLDKILKLYTLDNPELIASFSNVNLNLNVNNTLLFNNAIYSWDNNKIYKLDLESKQITEEASIKEDYGAPKFGSIFNEDNLFFYTQNKKFVRFNIKDKAFYDFKVEVSHELGDIQDAVIYGTRLYVLDKTNNQIYKYSKTTAGLGQETAWVQDQTNVQDFENIAIDGDIWSIKNNGEIVKMFTGQKQAWSATIEPSLSSPIKIYTELDYNYLYILDPGSQRLVIINKDGKIFKQFKSDKFDNLKNLSVDEPAGKVYLLNGTSIYQVDIK